MPVPREHVNSIIWYPYGKSISNNVTGLTSHLYFWDMSNENYKLPYTEGIILWF